MGLPKFMRPKGGAEENATSSNLYIANCGPAVGISLDMISSVFGAFGEVIGVYAADESGVRVIVSFMHDNSAQAALNALHGHPCLEFGGRILHIRYSIPRPSPSRVQGHDNVAVSLTASELNIPGVFLFLDFITAKQEEELLAAVDARPWNSLAKRRVQHYGFEFCYLMRNVDTKRHLGELPSFVCPILDRISTCSELGGAANIKLDQLTVNEYPPGVGLSPHIDTHSAFEDKIFSLSLAGPCIMEFRRYHEGTWKPESKCGMSNMENLENSTDFLRKAVFLPPRSMLLLSGEARYAWHHYIPHHKVDFIRDSPIRRCSRRVSFTLRKVRRGPCQCEYVEYCDSQRDKAKF
ncbi:Alkylated DNA repair protein alkB 8 [Ancistrocladus abbreviatus]